MADQSRSASPTDPGQVVARAWDLKCVPSYWKHLVTVPSFRVSDGYKQTASRPGTEQKGPIHHEVSQLAACLPSAETLCFLSVFPHKCLLVLARRKDCFSSWVLWEQVRLGSHCFLGAFPVPSSRKDTDGHTV